MRLFEALRLRVKDLDFARVGGVAALPDALKRKYPNAEREWAWQWVFPGRSGRYHLHPTAAQRAFRRRSGEWDQ